MDYSIDVDSLSKRYRLGGARRGGTLREAIAGGFLAPLRPAFRRLRSASPMRRRAEAAHLWALRDVGFLVKRGEAVGVIGRNGAGKSTLLKILSRITAPTDGCVQLRGKVGSLLEVGAGFHAELTGRENVYLNGAILGMGKSEIDRKFDAIVDFAEVRPFIDTPVKRFSSGMYVRLAFAVAAHLEPDILLVDEVLSVGDLAFQRKCMEYAKRLRRKNVTLVVVSHNMFTIKAMCDRAIHLSAGRVAFDGATEEATRRYDQEGGLDMAAWAEDQVGADPALCPIRVERLDLFDEGGRERVVFEHGERARVRIHYRATQRVVEPNFNICFTRSDGVACCCHNTAMDDFPTGEALGDGVIELLTPPLKLVAEMYTVQALIWDRTFERLYCAQTGRAFHVRHPVLSTEFGVYHERAQWSRPTGDAGAVPPVAAEIG